MHAGALLPAEGFAKVAALDLAVEALLVNDDVKAETIARANAVAALFKAILPDPSAETFRPNPSFKTEDAITQMGVGEALVSLLGDKGVPGMVERTLIRPPSSRLGPAELNERMSVMAASPVRGLYDETKDRDSAFELLQVRGERVANAQAQAEAQVLAEKQVTADAKEQVRLQREAERVAKEAARARKNSPVGMIEAAAKSAMTGAGRQLGSQLVRGILGSLLKRR